MTTQHTDNEFSDADAAAVQDVPTSENNVTTDATSPEATSSLVQDTTSQHEEMQTSLPATPVTSDESASDTNTGDAPIQDDAPLESTTSFASSEVHDATADATRSTSEPAAELVEAKEPATEMLNVAETPDKGTGGTEDATTIPDAQLDTQNIQTSANAEVATQIPASLHTQESLALIGEEATLAPAFELEERTESVFVAEPPVEANVQEASPFDFIAEFRQAAIEATQRESQKDAFSLLSPITDEKALAAEQPAKIEVDAAPIDPAPSAPSTSSEQPATTTEETDNKKTEEKEDLEKKNAARPVSPLLRPATRLRVPRHGVVNRHQRAEQQAVETPAEPSVQQQAKVETSPTTASDTTEQPAPRPARRYRFDRPAPQTTNGATSTSAPATPSTPAATANITPAVEEPRSNGDFATVTHEEPVQQKEANTPEVEHPAATTETGRKRHSQKESHAAANAQTQATTTPQNEEPATPTTTEVAPEDLPPLEYSDLQKVNSRRRRRHRSTAASPAPIASTNALSSVNNDAATPTPTPAIEQPPVAPVAPKQTTPFQPAAQQRVAESNGNGAYSIVSGYTVNQMNQGNDVRGPFMGPEPSPARGSVITRDGRTARAEMRPAPGGLYSQAPRPADNGFSTASMTQFANIVAQALQTQTDRLVSEFRHNNQSPANVSVSLPAFPSTERVGVFVDVANLIYSARTLRIGVDFGKLLDFLRGNRRLVRAQAYCPTSPQAGDEQMFLQAVKGLGYRITTKNYKTFSSGAKKADLDLDLCMDVVRLVDGKAVDCIVLVSGDSDFMPMLDYCFDHGVRVEVAAFDEAASATIRQGCDLFINLSMLDEIRA